MDKVLVKSKYNKKHYFKFYSVYLFRKSSTMYIFLIAGVISLFLAIKNTIAPEVPIESKVISWIMAFFVLTVIPFFSFGRIQGIIRRNLKEREDNLEIIEFTRFKISRFIENLTSKEVVGWEIFESVYEYEDLFLLYIDKERGLVIPKADIVEGDAETLEKLIKNNMKPTKKGKIKYKKLYKEAK